MASISREKNGRRTIQFFAPDKRRRSIRLGKVSQRVAEAVKVKVEHLVTSAITGHALDDETARWVANLDRELADRLTRVGLIPKREQATLRAFLEAYIESRADVKPLTKKKYVSTRKSLVAFLGPDKRLRDITPGDAEDWRLEILRGGRVENTARKHIAVAKLFFGAAVKKRLIPSNPFAGLKATILPNPERFYFVTRDETQKVLDACPDAQWRLIVVLSRYGGLRCPSETLSLTWRDIDWERGRIRVRSPKTEHHTGGESRIIPLFPELRPYLERVFEQAQTGAEYVIIEYRDTNQNLRSRLLDIIWAAGLKEWPKLFQNMRSTRETELAEQYPMHVVCQWIGNSEPVAAKHYLQVTDEHFRRAAEGGTGALQNPVQYAHVRDRERQEREREPPCFPEEHDSLRQYTTVKLAEAGLEPARE